MRSWRLRALHFQLSFWEANDPPFPPPWPGVQQCYGDFPGLHYVLHHGLCPYDDLIGRGEVLMSRERLLAALPPSAILSSTSLPWEGPVARWTHAEAPRGRNTSLHTGSR